MFCSNCGNQIPENTKFCTVCGKAQGSPQSPVSPPIAPVKQTKGKGKKIGGIVMAVLGGLSVLGSLANGFYNDILNYGASLSDLITVGLQIGLIVAGVIMIMKSNKA